MRYGLFSNFFLGLIFGVSLAVFPKIGAAQCVNSAVPSCGVYESCFAKFCPCSGSSDEYFLTYGQKYCERFLAKDNLSAAGKKWRDATLTCLQETIVPRLDISTSPQCDCAAMRKFAFDSHVACYTQPGASICDLPVSEMVSIGMTVDLFDIFTTDSMVQVSAVAAECLGQQLDAAQRAFWSQFQ